MDFLPVKGVRGRGTADNPANRFEGIAYEPDPDDGPPADRPAAKTLVFRDATRSILSRNDSPDVGFELSLNPYRGCEHGCSYCYARPTHEYLGLSAGLDFETKIMAKMEAPALLRAEFARKAYEPHVIAMSGVTDCYQPVERKLMITRGCMEVMAECRNPVAIVTKNALVTRDVDVLGELARYGAAAVFVSITTLDEDLARALEPRASRPALRIAAIETLAKAGVPVGVMTAPIIPGLNDHEMPAILKAAAKVGASFAGYTALRLPHGVAGLFDDWLKRNRPERKQKVLNQVMSLRGGKLNDPNFGSRMRGEGVWAAHFSKLFALARQKAGMTQRGPRLSTVAFRRPTGPQMELF